MRTESTIHCTTFQFRFNLITVYCHTCNGQPWSEQGREAVMTTNLVLTCVYINQHEHMEMERERERRKEMKQERKKDRTWLCCVFFLLFVLILVSITNCELCSIKHALYYVCVCVYIPLEGPNILTKVSKPDKSQWSTHLNDAHVLCFVLQTKRQKVYRTFYYRGCL